ncbi:B12-binding domain-containing protein [Methanolobus sp.]|jgi:trimethylamine corrinoid protein|uniref:cobalamin B12-binding domain-containing protein n=1 Tax=Methanolobus sp. TaxID=1874737 RepID=UPI0025CD15F8|nr:B12-binding domain-containing protein [Methanolobus sp.]
MLKKQEIIAKAKAAVMEFDDDAAKKVASDALAAGIDPAELIEEGFTVAMAIVGEQFAAGTLFLPHVIAAVDAMQAAIKILLPEMEQMGAQTKSRGTVVIGTIEGDIHSIGKDIVATALRIAGYNVVDLGSDVPIESYVEKAREVNADIVASSALMTITMINQMRIEEQLNEAGFRHNVITMVGGAPVTQEWADRIGADIYAENSGDAVNKITALFTRRPF